MGKPILRPWLDKKIESRERALQFAGSNETAERVLQYLQALRYGDVRFTDESVIHITTGDVLYHEYLLRVTDEEGEDLLTGNILDTLDRWDVLPLVGHYLIELALIQLQEHGGRVGINVPPQIFMAKELRTALDKRLKEAEKAGVSPDQVFLEILEAPFMDISEEMKPMITWMNRITKKGYKLGLDDFGAPDGCHTLGHVETLPIGFLKLDGTVVGSMLDGTFNLDAYMDVFAYCKENDIPIIAEHVETVENARKLRDLYPVTYVQSRHLKADDFK
jgi:EAL domain-containing protein (putative c-di-GMP-specific phosphodiesterase class I)